MKMLRWLFLLGLTVSPFSKVIAEEGLIDAIMRSDFRFDRNITNAPLFPLGYLTIADFGSSTLDDTCQSCELDMKGFSQGLALPVWVGKKDMLIAGETYSWDEVRFKQQDYTLKSAGVLGAWIRQQDEKWQLGTFAYVERSNSIGDNNQKYQQLFYGGVARYRHSATFHTYWGIVGQKDDFVEQYFPYIGLDWYINKEWLINILMPWPTVTYAPTEDYLFSFGAMPIDKKFFTQVEQQPVLGNISSWGFGTRFKHRVKKWWWMSYTLGKTGLSQLRFSNSQFDIESQLSSELYWQIGVEILPQEY